MKKQLFQILAVFMASLVATLPLASATTVNVIFNGQVHGTQDVSSKNIVNRQLTAVHDPSDITWSQVKVLVTVNSASLSHSVKKIYLYKCKNQEVANCIKTEPQIFESFADTELLWNDISAPDTQATFPQTANILLLVKVENQNNKASWVGFFDTIKRANFNTFVKLNYNLNEIDFHAKSSELADPALSFIQNFQMIPFEWAERVVFKGASQIFAVGGDELEFEVPNLQAAQPSSIDVSSISKDFFVIFPETTSGLGNAITLHKNPSFSCGNNVCESDLGESQGSCCVDCGCSAGEFCDAPKTQPLAGMCKVDDDISLGDVQIFTSTVSDCSQPVTVNVSAKINNPPLSLASSLQGVITLDGSPIATTCSGTAGVYSCGVSIKPKHSCGVGSFSLKNNLFNLTLAYNDGTNSLVKDVGKTLDDIQVSFTCGCPDGFFCDSKELACFSESSVSLSILNVTSYKPNFNPSGDSITLVAKITNPPSDLTITSATYTLGKTFKDGNEILNSTTGSVTCQGTTNHEYTCLIPLSISNYDHNFAYFIKQNRLDFDIGFSNGPKNVVKRISSGFADITIPGFTCGDTVCNVGETIANCCQDCGCGSAGEFCDIGVQHCSALNSVNLQILSVSPTNFTDCTPTTPHKATITTQVTNPPTDLKLDHAFYLQAGGVKADYNLKCTQVNPGANTGLFSCELLIPPISDCQLPHKALGPNTLNFSVAFGDGKGKIIRKSLEAPFEDLKITPVFHPGDGKCEGNLGENAANSCADCPCESDPQFGSDFYCDVTATNAGGQKTSSSAAGVCRNKNDIRLDITSPVGQISFDSCEKTQEIKIRAQLDNAPSNVLGISFSGTLNGTNAEFLRCSSQETGKSYGFSNTNFSAQIECDLRVPRIFECSKDTVFTYTPNSLSATILYKNGNGGSNLQTIEAPLPEIVTKQKIRSLYDINQEAIEKLREKIQKTKDIAEKMLEWVETCTEVALVLAIAGIAAMIFVPVASTYGGGTAAAGAGGAGAGALIGSAGGPVGSILGGLAGAGLFGSTYYNQHGQGANKPYKLNAPTSTDNYLTRDVDGKTYYFHKGTPTDNVNNAAFYKEGDQYWGTQRVQTNNAANLQQSLQTTAYIVNTVFNMWSTMCQLVNKQYETMINVQELQIRFIQTELCLDVAQHTIDSDGCKNAEQQCFNTMTSCLNFADIRSSTNQINKDLRETGTYLNQLGSQFVDLSNKLPQLTNAAGGAYMTVSCDGSTTKCCGFTYQRQAGYLTTTSDYRATNVRIDIKQNFPCAGGQYFAKLNGNLIQSSGVIGTAQNVFASTGVYSFQMYCGQPGLNENPIGNPVHVCYCQGTSTNGCTDSTGVIASCKATWNDPRCGGAAIHIDQNPAKQGVGTGTTTGKSILDYLAEAKAAGTALLPLIQVQTEITTALAAIETAISHANAKKYAEAQRALNGIGPFITKPVDVSLTEVKANAGKETEVKNHLSAMKVALQNAAAELGKKVNQQSASVKHDLSIAGTPTTVEKGKKITFSGKLTPPKTGARIKVTLAHETARQQSEVITAGEVQTTSSGDWVIEWTIPSTLSKIGKYQAVADETSGTKAASKFLDFTVIDAQAGTGSSTLSLSVNPGSVKPGEKVTFSGNLNPPKANGKIQVSIVHERGSENDLIKLPEVPITSTGDWATSWTVPSTISTFGTYDSGADEITGTKAQSQVVKFTIADTNSGSGTKPITIEVSPTTVKAGEKITFSGKVHTNIPSPQIDVAINNPLTNEAILLPRVFADSAGNWKAEWNIPSNKAPGVHNVIAREVQTLAISDIKLFTIAPSTQAGQNTVVITTPKTATQIAKTSALRISGTVTNPTNSLLTINLAATHSATYGNDNTKPQPLSATTAETAWTTTWDTSNLPADTYSLWAYVDGSPISEPITLTIAGQTNTPPTASFESFSPGATVTQSKASLFGNDIPLSLRVVDFDEKNTGDKFIKNVRIAVDPAVGPPVLVSPTLPGNSGFYKFEWDVKSLSPGLYTLVAIVTDNHDVTNIGQGDNANILKIDLKE